MLIVGIVVIVLVLAAIGWARECWLRRQPQLVQLPPLAPLPWFDVVPLPGRGHYVVGRCSGETYWRTSDAQEAHAMAQWLSQDQGAVMVESQAAKAAKCGPTSVTFTPSPELIRSIADAVFYARHSRITTTKGE